MVRKSIGPLGEGVHALETVLSNDQKTGDMLETVDKVFWFLEMEPELYVNPHRVGLDYLHHSRKDEIFQKVMSTPFDLVIVDELFATAQGAMALNLRKTFGTKVATFSTTDMSNSFSMYRAISRNPVTNPNYYSKGYNIHKFDLTDFYGRFDTIRDAIVEQYYMNIASNNLLIKAGELLNVSNSYREIYEASYATFMDFPNGYAFPTPIDSQFIHVGEHCQELRNFVEDPNSKGTIYIAFGSIVNWIVAPSDVITTFFSVLNSLTDYRIIFSYRGQQVEGLKPHVKILSWAPQNDILSHNKTILFFTHGGLKSVKEGICSDTAMLFLPFFADQPRNALFARELGVAEFMYKKNITVDELSYKIHKVLDDSNYGQRIRKIHRQYLDHVIEPLEYGSHWAIRLIKLNERHLFYYKNRGRLLSWFSFLYVDIFLCFYLLCMLLR